MDASALPWSNRYSVMLVGTPLSGSGTEILRAPLVVFDSLPKGVELTPGQRQCGDVELEERLPGIVEVLAKDDVLIFWAYRLKLGEPAAQATAFGGMVRLPRLAAESGSR